MTVRRPPRPAQQDLPRRKDAFYAPGGQRDQLNFLGRSRERGVVAAETYESPQIRRPVGNAVRDGEAATKPKGPGRAHWTRDAEQTQGHSVIRTGYKL